MSESEQYNEEPVETEQSDDTQVNIAEKPIIALPKVDVNRDTGTVGADMSPVMHELQGEPEQQVNEEVFEEIPVEVCGQMYQTVLEVGYTLKNKGMPMRELPESRVKTQAQIIYGIMKKNQINIKHIDLFMLGAGMMGDWKYMSSFSDEQKKEAANAGSATENKSGKYGEIE